MARKLVFDRTIWITRDQPANIVVPKGELWKVGFGSCARGESFYVSDSYFNSADSWDRVLAGGATVQMGEISLLNGIAFKIVEE